VRWGGEVGRGGGEGWRGGEGPLPAAHRGAGWREGLCGGGWRGWRRVGAVAWRGVSEGWRARVQSEVETNSATGQGLFPAFCDWHGKGWGWGRTLVGGVGCGRAWAGGAESGGWERGGGPPSPRPLSGGVQWGVARGGVEYKRRGVCGRVAWPWRGVAALGGIKTINKWCHKKGAPSCFSLLGWLQERGAGGTGAASGWVGVGGACVGPGEWGCWGARAQGRGPPSPRPPWVAVARGGISWSGVTRGGLGGG